MSVDLLNTKIIIMFIYFKYIIMDIKIKLWNRIKEIRMKNSISQEQLGFKSKLHRTYLSSIERWLKNVSVENIEKIALALWVEVKDLFN